MAANAPESSVPGWYLELVESIAAKIGTPFLLYRAETIRKKIADIKDMTSGPGLQARFAMKACSLHCVLKEMRDSGIWIDSVSGNEVLRALGAGFDSGQNPPKILYTSDVFRDNALEVITRENVLANIGTPQMIDDLAATGYRGAIGLRINPGFGHGHVQACDTGGPSSKHGIWFEDIDAAKKRADAAGLEVTLLHAHIGTGAEVSEFQVNIQKLVDFFVHHFDVFPKTEVVNIGGGFPHPYRPETPRIDLAACAGILREAQQIFSQKAGREIRVEVEPGRIYVADGASLITRVHGVKRTATNEKGPGQKFVMVDAGFCDLIRPAMYGSYHAIEVLGKHGEQEEDLVIAGPMCESGDVFTRDDRELLDPRSLPTPAVGDFIAIHDAGAYGEAMSSNYVSLGRVPQVWYDNGKAHLSSRRQTLEDILRTECFEEL
jgi:diaminopimelate decarboxylase